MLRYYVKAERNQEHSVVQESERQGFAESLFGVLCRVEQYVTATKAADITLAIFEDGKEPMLLHKAHYLHNWQEAPQDVKLTIHDDGTYSLHNCTALAF